MSGIGKRYLELKRKKRKMLNEPPWSGMEEDEHFCDHCEEYTPHYCHYSDHERDATSDYFICRICGWYYSGYTGKYHEP